MYCQKCGTILQNGECLNCKATKKAGNVWAVFAAIPAALFGLFLLIVPICKTFLLSFKEYRPIQGWLQSPWVGFENYMEFTGSKAFGMVFTNSVLQGLLCIIAGTINVFALCCLLSVIKNKWGRYGVLSVVLLTAFLPLHIFVSFLPSELLQNAALYRFVPVVNEVFYIAPLAVLAGSFALKENFEWKRISYITLSYIALRLTLFLFPDLQAQLATYNPAVYSTADVFGTYQYRSGLQSLNLGQGCAANIIQVLLNFVPWLIGGFLLFKINCGNRASNISAKSNGNILTPLLIACGSVAALLLSMIFAFLATVLLKLNLQIFGNVLFASACCLSAAVFALGLAYPMIAGNKAVSISVLAMSVCLLPLCGNFIGQYLCVRELGMANSLFAAVLQNASWGLFAAFGLTISTGRQNNASEKELWHKLLPPSVIFLCIGFCKFYASYYLYPMLFLNDRSQYPFPLLLHELTIMAATESVPGLSRLSPAWWVPYFFVILVGLAALWLSSILKSKTEE